VTGSLTRSWAKSVGVFGTFVWWAALILAIFGAPAAHGADACPDLAFETSGNARVSTTSSCRVVRMLSNFAPGQYAQLTYRPPAGFTVREVEITSDSEYGPFFDGYLNIDGQEQPFGEEVSLDGLRASAITAGIRCDPASGDRGCAGDALSLDLFDVQLNKIPIPITAANPQKCNDDAAQQAGEDFLEDYARRTYPRYWRGIAPDHWITSAGWHLYRVFCRDLTGDGQSEMVAYWSGPTGGAIDPWAIFKRDGTGHWRMAYAQVRDTTYRLSFRGRSVVAPKVAKYEGASTYIYRKRTVRWNGNRFVSKLGPKYAIHNPNRD
jgi:hypothetical protein